MLSMLHHAWVDFFQRVPEMAPEVLRRFCGIRVPEYNSIRLGGLTDLCPWLPTEARAEAIVLLAHDIPVYAIALDVQLSVDPLKRWIWPMFVTTLRARYQCPTVLLVYTPEERIHRWCSEPIDLGGVLSQVCPIVIGPSRIPLMVELRQALQTPYMAILSALVHGNEYEVGVRQLMFAFRALENFASAEYTALYDIIAAALDEHAREALEVEMRTENYQFKSVPLKEAFARGLHEGMQKGLNEGIERGLGRGMAKGYSEGLSQGKCRAIIAVLESRSIEVTSLQREQILQCKDIDQVDLWLSKVATVATIELLFS